MKAEVIPSEAHGTEMGLLLQKAVDAKLDVASLERLAALYNQQEDRNAEREFYRALAAFQAACPPVPKTSKAEIATKSGARYGYTYAELDQIARTVGPHLHKLGLSYTWDMAEEAGRLTCTCWLRHENGHKISASFVAPVDTAAAMSGPQKQASALTYARRQSLVAVLGLTTADEDPDGGGGDEERITEEQARTLDDLLVGIGATVDSPVRARFLKAYAIQHLDELPASKFGAACEQVKAKGKR